MPQSPTIAKMHALAQQLRAAGDDLDRKARGGGANNHPGYVKAAPPPRLSSKFDLWKRRINPTEHRVSH